MKKKPFRKKRPVIPESGITLIETLIALAVVLFGVICACKALIFGLDSQKKSRIRLSVQQEVQIQSQKFMSRPFHSPELSPGKKIRRESPFEIRWEITEISPTLKLVNLWVKRGSLTVRSYLYKSRHIKEIPAGFTNAGGA